MAELYHSSVNIPSLRKTAPQWDPGMVRMAGGEGLTKVGEALFGVGEKMHKVNVARQVARALAKFKMRATDYLANVAIGDPSVSGGGAGGGAISGAVGGCGGTGGCGTSGCEGGSGCAGGAHSIGHGSFNTFMAGHADLFEGISRDAAHLLEIKMLEAGASLYGQAKRQEIANQRELVNEELPEVIQAMADEEAAAILKGDKKGAAAARQNFTQYRAGVAPILRPGEELKADTDYGKALEAAIKHKAYQMGSAISRQDPLGLVEAIKDPESEKGQEYDFLGYLDETQKTTLWKSSYAESNRSLKIASIQQKQMQNEQAGKILDIVQQHKYVPVEATSGVKDKELIMLINAINERASANLIEQNNYQHPLYHDLKKKVRITESDVTPVLTEMQLLEAQAVLGTEQVQELRESSQTNIKLLDKLKKVYPVITTINRDIETIIESVIVQFAGDTDTLRVILRELEDERDTLISDVKAQFIQGKSKLEIEKDLADVFEATKKGIIASRWKYSTRGNRFTPEVIFTPEIVEPSKYMPGMDPERVRVRAMINLLLAGDYDREIEAMIEAGWFTE